MHAREEHIIGICVFGPVGKFIRAFSAFLVGEHYNILLALVALIGIYVMVKREKPNFFTSNLVGLYVIIISALMLYHIDYVERFEGMEVLTETVNNLMAFTEGNNNLYGGGIIGALFALGFVKLFSIQGTVVIGWVLIVCGVIMFTGLSIYDMVKIVKGKTKNLVKHKFNSGNNSFVEKTFNPFRIK